MKTNFKSFALAAAVLLGMGACSNELDEQLQQAEGQPLTFNFSIHNGATTKTTTTGDNNRVTSWAEGDEVGIFVYNAGTNVANNLTPIKSCKLTYTNGAWAGDQIDSGTAYDIYAYYPYQENATDPTKIDFTISQDQSSADKYALNDVLASKVTTTAEAQNVNMQFHHMFSLVEIIVGGDFVSATAPTEVTLDNIVSSATLNISSVDKPTAVIKEGGNPANIKALFLRSEQGKHYYRAVIPAQTIAKGMSLVTISGVNGKNYSMDFSSDVKYQAGVCHQISVNLSPKKIALVIGTTGIDQWESGGKFEGEGGEIIKPIETFSVPFAAAEFTSIEGWTTSVGHIAADKDMWYHREKNSPALTTPKLENNTLVLTTTAKAGSWNNSSVVYHKTGKFERTTYKLEITFAGDAAEAQFGIGFTNSDDSKLFRLLNASGGELFRTIHSVKVKDNNELNLTFYLDCRYSIARGSGSKIGDDQVVDGVRYYYSESVPAEVETGLNVILYNYSANHSITVKSVTLTKDNSIDPAAPKLEYVPAAK